MTQEDIEAVIAVLLDPKAYNLEPPTYCTAKRKALPFKQMGYSPTLYSPTNPQCTPTYERVI
jgi:hypothetical protein